MAQHVLRMGAGPVCSPVTRRAHTSAHSASYCHTSHATGAQPRFTLHMSQADHHPPGPGCRQSVACQAHPRRVAKVAAEMQRVISNMFITDEVLVAAITPERAGGLRDLSALVSITDVYVSRDLQVVKVYVSIYSDERGKQQAMKNLKRLEWYVRKQIGSKVVLRLTPEIRFEYDDSQEEADLIERVIGEEDVARYKAELEAETRAARGWAGVESQPAAQPTTAGAEGTQESGGFFDDLVDNQEEEEDEWVEFSTADVFKRAGPFDFMFESPASPPRYPQYKTQDKPQRRTGRNTRGEGRETRNKRSNPAVRSN